MNNSTFLRLFYNAELLISLVIFYPITSYLKLKWDRSANIIGGVLLGCIGILLMAFPLQFAQGISFDTRSVLLGASALTFGIIPVMIAASIMILYRIYLGGAGVYMGILVILSSVSIGYFWPHIKKFLHIKNIWINLYLFGLVIHIVMLMFTLLLPSTSILPTLQAVLLPVMIIYPILTVIVTQILLSQKSIQENNLKILEAERKFHSVFDYAAIGIGYVTLGGKFIDLNQKLSAMLGYIPDELRLLNFDDITLAEDLNNDHLDRENLLRRKIDNYSVDKRMVKRNGTILWMNLSVSLIINNEDDPSYMICTFMDISERRSAEQLMTYLTYHDPETGVWNRRYYEENILKINTSENLPITLVLVDVNGLKLINDAFGYISGDAILRKVAEILTQECTENDQISRINGSCFIVAFNKLTLPTIDSVFRRINDRIAAVKIESIQLSISIGMAVKSTMNEDIQKVYKEAKDKLDKEKLNDRTSMISKTINIIMSSLFEKNQREMYHSARVSEICKQIAINMDLDKGEINKIRVAGLMHDIGKIGISDRILNKIEPLTTDEWEEIKRHSEIGYRILSSANEFSEIAEFILSHHERWDGTGYPKGLKGTEIPYQSRVIAIADSFDAMTSDRTYRKALSYPDAIQEIKRNAGSQFDPEIVDLFISKILPKINVDVLFDLDAQNTDFNDLDITLSTIISAPKEE